MKIVKPLVLISMFFIGTSCLRQSIPSQKDVLLAQSANSKDPLIKDANYIIALSEDFIYLVQYARTKSPLFAEIAKTVSKLIKAEGEVFSFRLETIHEGTGAYGFAWFVSTRKNHYFFTGGGFSVDGQIHKRIIKAERVVELRKTLFKNDFSELSINLDNDFVLGPTIYLLTGFDFGKRSTCAILAPSTGEEETVAEGEETKYVNIIWKVQEIINPKRHQEKIIKRAEWLKLFKRFKEQEAFEKQEQLEKIGEPK